MCYAPFKVSRVPTYFFNISGRTNMGIVIVPIFISHLNSYYKWVWRNHACMSWHLFHSCKQSDYYNGKTFFTNYFAVITTNISSFAQGCYALNASHNKEKATDTCRQV